MNRQINPTIEQGASATQARRTLLLDIQALSFAKDEAALFLNTHPTNRSALTYFHETCEKIKKLVEKYEAEYGPLTSCGVQGDVWTWINGPWPWQNDAQGQALCDEEGRE